jgi:hypothetical protein
VWKSGNGQIGENDKHEANTSIGLTKLGYRREQRHSLGNDSFSFFTLLFTLEKVSVICPIISLS